MTAWTWVGLTLFAVVMQSVRTAGQKHLTAHLDAIAVTLVRFLFGLPFAALFLVAVLAVPGTSAPAMHGQFLILCLVSSIMQIVATALLIYLFSLRNFAVGTTYARTEAFLTAMVGALFFQELITPSGWAAIVISVLGVIVLTVARTNIAAASLLGRLWNKPALIGLSSGLAFALCSLTLRRASLSLGHESFLVNAGMTLLTMVVMQTVMVCVYLGLRNAGQFRVMAAQWPLCLFVGVTSALGSIGWFTAMTLERASYVKALGQIEFFLALAISTLFFKERSSRTELIGMALIAAGVVILVLAA